MQTLTLKQISQVLLNDKAIIKTEINKQNQAVYNTIMFLDDEGIPETYGHDGSIDDYSTVDNLEWIYNVTGTSLIEFLASDEAEETTFVEVEKLTCIPEAIGELGLLVALANDKALLVADGDNDYFVIQLGGASEIETWYQPDKNEQFYLHDGIDIDDLLQNGSDYQVIHPVNAQTITPIVWKENPYSSDAIQGL